jgi:hypothetical protein
MSGRTFLEKILGLQNAFAERKWVCRLKAKSSVQGLVGRLPDLVFAVWVPFCVF